MSFYNISSIEEFDEFINNYKSLDKTIPSDFYKSVLTDLNFPFEYLDKYFNEFGIIDILIYQKPTSEFFEKYYDYIDFTTLYHEHFNNIYANILINGSFVIDSNRVLDFKTNLDIDLVFKHYKMGSIIQYLMSNQISLLDGYKTSFPQELDAQKERIIHHIFKNLDDIKKTTSIDIVKQLCRVMFMYRQFIDIVYEYRSIIRNELEVYIPLYIDVIPDGMIKTFVKEGYIEFYKVVKKYSLNDFDKFYKFLKMFDDWKELVDWSSISNRFNLSHDFIRENSYKLNWNKNNFYIYNREFFEEFKDNIEWSFERIIINNDFATIPTIEEFLSNNSDLINWENLNYFNIFSSDFINKFREKINWDIARERGFKIKNSHLCNIDLIIANIDCFDNFKHIPNNLTLEQFKSLENLFNLPKITDFGNCSFEILEYAYDNNLISDNNIKINIVRTKYLTPSQCEKIGIEPFSYIDMIFDSYTDEDRGFSILMRDNTFDIELNGEVFNIQHDLTNYLYQNYSNEMCNEILKQVMLMRQRVVKLTSIK